jgi:cell division protein FtsW (lipid II flippase)
MSNYGIRGWLVIPAIGLPLGALLCAVGLLAAYGAHPEQAASGYGDVETQMELDMCFIVFTILAATAFFRMKRYTKYLMIGLYVFSVFVPIEGIFVGRMDSGEVYINVVRFGTAEAIRDIAALLWIFYFLLSDRVRETFVR